MVYYEIHIWLFLQASLSDMLSQQSLCQCDPGSRGGTGTLVRSSVAPLSPRRTNQAADV